MTNPDQAAQRVLAFVNDFRQHYPSLEQITDGLSGYTIDVDDLHALVRVHTDWPTCDTCGNEHPTEPADPGAFLEKYRERFRNARHLSATDTEAVLEWAYCIVGQHRETVADYHNLTITAVRMEGRLTELSAAASDETATRETYYGVRDRHGNINERPSLDDAARQYNNMVADARLLGFTAAELGAEVVQSDAVTTRTPWRPVHDPVCPDCGGSGGHGDEPCNTCGGNYSRHSASAQPDIDDPWGAHPTPPPRHFEPIPSIDEPPF